MVVAVGVIVGATLLPSEPSNQVDWQQVFCVLCGRAAVADGLANVTLFVPLGIALALAGYVPRCALLLAASLSLTVELAQFAIPGRDPSLGDFLFNTLGAGLGDAIMRLAPRLAHPNARVASRLSLVAGIMAAGAFAMTDVLLTPSLPDTAYFGGSASLQSSNRPLRLGGSIEPRGYFEGRIDEVRIYRRARTPAEIQADMRTPVATVPPPPELVAAYNFDEGAGSSLTDVAGRGNDGQIRGATWTMQGRFGGALDFDGVGAVVVIPHSPSLDLTSALTLEAWLYPTAAQTGWRAIVQKEFDTYFLFASSRAGPLRPGGGAIFGASTEMLATPAVVPAHAWTHVAVTYDGAVLQLYVDGHPVARRLRWYPGRVLAATLDGLTVPAGLSADSPLLRARLLAGAPLRVRAVAAPPVPTRAPLAMLQDAWRNEILLLAAHGDDLVFRLRTRAAAAELDSPLIRASGVLRGLSPGDTLDVTLSRPGRRYCVAVNGRSTCGLSYTLGMGWTFFVYSQVPSGWPHTALGVSWMAALVFPFGFWLQRRWESLVGALVLVTGIVLACALGSLNAELTELGGAIAGVALGVACARGRAVFAGGRARMLICRGS